jgi:alkyl hydroperoxide reductase subunit F
MMDSQIRKEVQTFLKDLKHDVKISFFTSATNCQYCDKQHSLLKELATLSDKFSLEVYDILKNKEIADTYKINKVPATVIISTKDFGIRFFGISGGHEFSSLLQAVMMVSTEKTGLHPELERYIKEIDKQVHIEVMVTLTCPYCPQAVHAAQQLALINDNICADMIESAEFPDLAEKYDVYSTPKTIINETYSFVGAQPAQAVYLEVLKAIDPDKYRHIEATMREISGHRHVLEADTEKIYDCVVIGGGPAAMSASLYAARKQLNVLLVSKDIGGQMTYTAAIDNYLGLPGISGKDMKEQFMFHLEQYPIAESLNATVVDITQQNDVFTVVTANETSYKAHAVIYCAGKEYRRLGVKGEEKYIGRGIAFCATCDAPLYKNKKVAVVGGGNSAFTAARDLIGYAKEIHIIHRRQTFTADSSIVEEIKKGKNITVHTNMVINEFYGDEHLTGVIMQTTKGKNTEKLTVDGVFLEIGLVPNTDPVKELIILNERGEIPVQQDNSTSILGFFAAGDATDVPEKQIIVAAGEGAKAAISVYKYLIKGKKIQKTTEDVWA